MRLRSALLALSILPAALFSVAALDEASCTTYSDAGTPDDTTDDVIMCTEVNYLSCENTVDPAGKLSNPTATTVPLVPDAPATSFTDGGGCGTPEVPVFRGTSQGTMYSFDTAGFFATNIDTLTVELHDLGPHENAVYAAQGAEVNLTVRITIDETSLFGSEDVTAADGTVVSSPTTVTVPITAELSETGLSSKYVFTVTNIGIDQPGLLAPASAMQFHNVKVTVDFPGTVETPAVYPPSDNIAPVWGATEVPANITVNGEVLGAVVDATAHN